MVTLDVLPGGTSLRGNRVRLCGLRPANSRGSALRDFGDCDASSTLNHSFGFGSGDCNQVTAIKQVTIYEYQKGLKYTRRALRGHLERGPIRIVTKFLSIAPIDVRPEYITLQGQDVLSADGVTLKVSIAAEFQVTDPNIAVNKNANFSGEVST